MTGSALVDAMYGAQYLGVIMSLRYGGLQRMPWLRWQAAGTASIGLAFSLLNGWWPAAGFCAGTLLLLLRDWWSRRGRKAARALGMKSRALVEGLARKLREALEPVPEGARA